MKEVLWLSEQEQRDVYLGILHIMRTPNLGISLNDIRWATQNLKELYLQKKIKRDEFGLHPICIALETIKLAIDEIGLKGKSLLVSLFKFGVENEDIIKDIRREDDCNFFSQLKSYKKIALLLKTKEETLRTDTFRNLVISQCGDMRVMLLLIAESVIKMRKVRDVENIDARHKLSVEAAALYAPLAHKLGLYTLKSELEDLSLKYLEHDAYYHIKEKLNATKKSRDAYIAAFIAPLKDKLQALGLRFHIKGRTKSIHSIWQKMKKQRCAFEGVYDLFAIRIIIDAPINKEKDLCWKAFSVITGQYESNLKRLRDWLTVPKSNGYESLHITVLGPQEKWVEVQIRSERMDEVAEHGLAAHWRYKGVKATGDGIDSWLSNIRDALETGDEKKLSDSWGTDIGEKFIYVFSPKGDLYKLSEGATVLDFAYLIHTRVGDHCIGARIDGKNVPIRYILESGQKVEIITSNAQTPKLEWLQFVVSPRAKAKIRASVNELTYSDTSLVREVLERRLKNRKIEWVEGIWNQLIKKNGYKEGNEFYKAISDEVLDVNDIIEQYIEIQSRERNPQDRVALHGADEYNLKQTKEHLNIGDSDVLVIDQNLKGIDFQMARCCNPVYGDDVFGFVTVNGGIKIHRKTCPNAKALKSRFGYRIVKAKWSGKGVGTYPITLHIVGNDDLGIINNITSVIAKEEHIMLRSINIDSNDGLFSGILTVLVKDTTMLNSLIKKIKGIRGVKAVGRS